MAKKHKKFYKRLSNSLLLLLLSVAGVYMAIKVIAGFSYTASFEILSRISAAAIVLAIMLLATLVLKQRPIHTLLSITAYGVAFMVALILILLSFSSIQDVFSVNCAGLFGAISNCVTNQWFAISITLLNPYVIIAIGLLSLFAITMQFNKPS